MRIIAGKYKKTPIKTLEGDDITRPTRDMVKEALFSSIEIYSDTRFLDLFSGTGSIGLEALSRGCADAVFNDINKSAVKIIKENLNKVKENRDVYNLDYQECLAKLEGQKFDYIYCDPPYKFSAYEEILYYVDKYKLLNKKGIIIMEVRKDTDLKDTYLNMNLYKEKRYGINKLYYYKMGD
ncbi:MAG: 16S rRNA (guanine(966)-N(2))-methyltransferase RsmD [Erysipelotrichaceae bacterium]|nr:16S rRNA (guanine(966)-N(2))-methyltransferase RsmD [Erysipelotrichaceae bacterium]